jgi:threonyl-tRNA synthetase
MAKAAERLTSLAQKGQKITITLPDTRTIDGVAFETSPYSVAQSLSKSLADRVVVAKVSGALWDLHRPLESDCNLQLLDFDSSQEGNNNNNMMIKKFL